MISRFVRPVSQGARIDYAVLGGGTTGLAVTAALSAHGTTFGLNRAGKGRAVVQSGIYLEPGTLASRLVVEGRGLLYDRAGIDYQKTAKLVVATANNQVPHLDMLSSRSLHPALRRSKATLGSSDTDSTIPAYFLSGDDARGMEPALSDRVIGAVLLTEAGTVDAQALDESLVHEVEENHGAILDTEASVERIGNEWQVTFTVDGQEDAFRAARLVRFAGPNATERYLAYGELSGIQIHPSPMNGSDMAFARMALGRFGPIYHDVTSSQIQNIGRGIQTFLDIDPDRLRLEQGRHVDLSEFDIRDEDIIEVSGSDGLGVAASLSIARHITDIVLKGKQDVEELAKGWEL